jgi:hypothetical protein
MSSIRFHLRGSRALINGSLAIQNDGSRTASSWLEPSGALRLAPRGTW